MASRGDRPLLNRPAFRLLAGGVVAVALSAAFLAGPARDTMDGSTAVAILIHLGLGILLIPPVAWALVQAVRRERGRGLRLLLLCLAAVTCLCAASGIYLAARAATGHSTAHDQLSGALHNATGLASVTLGAVWLFSQLQIRPKKIGTASHAPTNSALTPPSHPLTLSPSHPLILLLLVLAQGALFGAAALAPDYDAEEYYRDLTSTTREQAQNPLFPAGLRMESAQALKSVQSGHRPLPASSSCGVTGCHPAAYHEWQDSAHRFAGSDPFYLAALDESIRTSGPETARWCQGCHEPPSAIRGTIAGDHSLMGAGDPATRFPGSPAGPASEGVGCYTCHATTGTPTRTGNGRFLLAEPQDYPFAGDRGWRRGLHDFLIRVRPGPHQRAFLKPELHRSAEFCSGCHRQSMTVAQNHYQFVRGPDEYGEWMRGPASGRPAPKAFGAARLQTCQECHFRDAAAGFGGGRVSHGAPGGNTALAALRGDGAASDALRKRLRGDGAASDALRKRLRGSVSLDLFALRREGAPARSEAPVAPLDHPLAPYTLHPGETWLLDVVVRNRGGGHDFPAGYPDLTDAWLELTVDDSSGKTLLSNGVLADPGANVPEGAHTYGALALDRTGAPILRHNITAQITTAYRRTIPAGGADVARFRVVVPGPLPSKIGSAPPPRGYPAPKVGRQGGNSGGRAGPSLRLKVRLRYRSIRPDYARWALAAAAPAARPGQAAYTPPITDLVEATVSLPFRQAADASVEQDNTLRRSVAERFEAYGTGLLAPREKPDIGGAVTAFSAARKLTPDRPEPWLGLGRAYLREPDLTLAAANFEKALRCAPGSPAAIAELSVVYNKQGQPDRAIQALTPLAAAFPLDPELCYDLGLALFRAGRYPEAAASFRRALAIDPDQYAAHFQLKRCNEVLRRVPDARVEDSITRYMAEDRAAARLVPRYLAKHPAAAQPFPVHALLPRP